MSGGGYWNAFLCIKISPWLIRNKKKELCHHQKDTVIEHFKVHIKLLSKIKKIRRVRKRCWGATWHYARMRTHKGHATMWPSGPAAFVRGCSIRAKH